MSRPAEPGVPLADFRRFGDVGVLVICRRCQDRRVFALEAVIARLAARGLAAEAMGIRRVAAHVRSPCAACGCPSFETRPHYPGIPGMDGTRPPGA